MCTVGREAFDFYADGEHFHVMVASMLFPKRPLNHRVYRVRILRIIAGALASYPQTRPTHSLIHAAFFEFAKGHAIASGFLAFYNRLNSDKIQKLRLSGVRIYGADADQATRSRHPTG